MNENNNVNTSGGFYGVAGNITGQNVNVNFLGTNSSESQASSGLNQMGLTSSQGSDQRYIERPPLEQFCCEQIQEATCLIQITAPARMGKTMLVNRTLDSARARQYKTIKIDFKDPRSPKTKDDFLSHLCSELSSILNIHCSRNSINEDCLIYLIDKMEDNLLLALDSFEVLFSREEDCVDIGSFLRFCHEQAKSCDTVGKNFRKLRIMIAYSTAKIPDFPTINQSPFNVGKIVDDNGWLKGFTSEQAKELLSTNYPQLTIRLSNTDLLSLVDFLNGNPELIQQSFLHLNYSQKTMENFLEEAPTEQGIFLKHLRFLLRTLMQQSPSIIEDYKRVLTQGPTQLRDDESSFVLRNLGVIKPLGNDYISSCNLYFQYFSNKFS